MDSYELVEVIRFDVLGVFVEEFVISSWRIFEVHRVSLIFWCTRITELHDARFFPKPFFHEFDRCFEVPTGYAVYPELSKAMNNALAL